MILTITHMEPVQIRVATLDYAIHLSVEALMQNPDVDLTLESEAGEEVDAADFVVWHSACDMR